LKTPKSKGKKQGKMIKCKGKKQDKMIESKGKKSGAASSA